jgi:hypothetical protein
VPCYEVMNMLRKGQVRGVSKGDIPSLQFLRGGGFNRSIEGRN